MHFTKLVPQACYTDIKIALKTFVDCLEFNIAHEELNSGTPFCIVTKNGIDIMLFENAEWATHDHPEFRLVTNNIEEVYEKVSTNFPVLLHPNLSKITLRPWGAKEFALMDGQIGIIVQQW